MELSLSNPVFLLLIIVNSLVPIGILYLYFVAVYKTLIKRSRLDKVGKKWLRIIAQICIVSPIFTIVLGAYLLLMQLISESYRQGCTSGPGIGDCFGHGVLFAISLPFVSGAFIVGLILYRFSTQLADSQF